MKGSVSPIMRKDSKKYTYRVNEFQNIESMLLRYKIGGQEPSELHVVAKNA